MSYDSVHYKKHRDYYISYQMGVYNRRKAEGVCVACGKTKAEANRVRCADCLLKSIENQRRRYHER